MLFLALRVVEESSGWQFLLGPCLALVKVLDASLSRLLLHFSLQSTVEVILYMVIGATVQKSRDFGPPVAEFLVKFEDLLVLFLGPPILLDVGVEVIVPALAALLSDASLNVMSDLAPILSTVDAHHIDETAVLLLRPGTLHHLRVEHLLPAV